jgi:hypothetical protein
MSEADIRHAFTNPRYDGPIEGVDTGNRYIRLGFDTNGNLLEMLEPVAKLKFCNSLALQ